MSVTWCYMAVEWKPATSGGVGVPLLQVGLLTSNVNELSWEMVCINAYYNNVGDVEIT